MIAENDTSFGSDVDASLEWVCTHELSHGLMDYVEEDLRKAAGYWKDTNTKTGAGEEPWSGYAKTSLGEDLAESATAYFIKRGRSRPSAQALRGRRRRGQGLEGARRPPLRPRRRAPPAPPPRAAGVGAGVAGGRLPRAPRRRRRRSLSLPRPIEEARALAGSSRADVLARSARARTPSPRGRVRAALRPRRVETPTGRVVFDGDRVAVVYLSGHAMRPTKPDDLLAELGDGETLPGAASAGSEAARLCGPGPGVLPRRAQARDGGGVPADHAGGLPRDAVPRSAAVHHLRTALS